MSQKFILNPNAVPYIPISKISAKKSLKDESITAEPELVVAKDFEASRGFQIADPVSGQYIYNFKEPYTSEESFSAFTHQSSKFDEVEDSLSMDNYDYLDAEQNIMEILTSRHPDFSVESLVDVLNANRGDLDATINALDQLEEDYDSTSEEFSEGLDLDDDTVHGFEKGNSSGSGSS